MYQPGDVLPAWVHPSLEARTSSISGKGTFALQPIQLGEVVIVWGGTIFSRAEILAGKADPETIAILEEGTYLADPIGALAVEDYSINHSCDSNLWLQDAITLVARRYIAAGEELTADYALWLYDVDWVLDPCKCGSPLCRGRVVGSDWRIPELQSRYQGHFTPYINGLIVEIETQSEGNIKTGQP